MIHKGDIWIVPLNGEKPIQITDTPEKERWVDWSPDDKMIGYLIPNEQTAMMYIVPATGGESKVISRDIKTWGWASDSKSGNHRPR